MRRLMLLSSCTILLAGLSITEAGLIGHWTLDETSGTVASDSSGKDHPGAYVNNPGLNVPGVYGTAMDSATGYMQVDLGNDLPTGAEERTIALWLSPVTNNADSKFISYGNTASGGAFTFTVESVNNEIGVRLRHWGGNYTYPGITVGEWNHIAAVVPPGSTNVSDVQAYIDGVQAPGTMTAGSDVALVTASSLFYVGTAHSSPGALFQGVFDDVFFFDHGLNEQEVLAVMAGGKSETASNPSPANAATDLPYYTDALSWTPNDTAVKRDVYFGTSPDDVNDASVADPRGVLVGAGLTDTFLAMPEALALETTYYWRVDEVNTPPDNTVFKGDVWSFTVEPLSLPIAHVSATASSQADLEQGAKRTVDGSGLNANDGHSSRMEDMWLNSMTESTGAWIAYDLGQSYTLHHMQVWNHNSQAEAILGTGLKEARVETSLDGENWTEFATVELPQAPGSDTYTGSEIALDEVVAQYVRINALSNYSLIGLAQVGLAEVRFYSVPVAPREFSPARGTDTEDLSVTLSWRAGRYTAEHRVLHSTDRDAVADGSAVITTTPDKSVDLSDLAYGQLNYWQVIDVTADGIEYSSDIMTFYTAQSGMIDNMESYKAEEGLFIWEHWIDGFDNPDENGAVVGNGDEAERVVVFEGSQSLPMTYSNASAPVSEATLTFDTAQDLTAGNPESLQLQVRGDAPGFVDNGDGTLTVGAAGADIWTTADDFRFVYKRLSGDGSITARVNSAMDVHEWVKAGVMIRESLSVDGTNAYSFATPRGRVGTQWRVDAFGATVSTQSQNNGTIALPYWVRLTRTGTMFKGEHSVDGVTWMPMVSEDVPDDPTARDIFMIPDVYLGLAVTSHVTGTPTVAVFSDVTTTGSVTGPWISEAIGTDTHPDNDAAPMYVRLADTSGKEKVFDHPNPEATLMTAWDEWTIPIADLGPINPAKLDSITVGVSSAGVSGKIYVDAIRVSRPAAAAPPAEVSPEGLIARYEFENGGTDSTGNNPGTLDGNATTTPDGKMGQALNLVILPDADGVDVGSWVAIDNLNYQATGLLAVSVTAWARTSLETDQIIASFDRNEYWRLEINGNGAGPGQVGWDIMTDAGQIDYGSVTRVDDGEWHHLAGVFDQGTLRLFIDGVPEAATTGGTTWGSGNLRYGFLGAGSEAIEFNGAQNAPPNHFVGDLDDVRIFHRALLPGEITTLASQ